MCNSNSNSNSNRGVVLHIMFICSYKKGGYGDWNLEKTRSFCVGCGWEWEWEWEWESCACNVMYVCMLFEIQERIEDSVLFFLNALFSTIR